MKTEYRHSSFCSTIFHSFVALFLESTTAKHPAPTKPSAATHHRESEKSDPTAATWGSFVYSGVVLGTSAGSELSLSSVAAEFATYFEDVFFFGVGAGVSTFGAEATSRAAIIAAAFLSIVICCAALHVELPFHAVQALPSGRSAARAVNAIAP